MEAITVASLNRRIKQVLQQDFLLQNAYVKGTISGLKKHQGGHYYFTLKDEEVEAKVDVAIFKGTIAGKPYLKKLEDGLSVIIKCNVNFYEPWGRLNLIATDVMVDQMSTLQLAFEALKKELASLGYFDEEHKQELPYLSSCIGMVTSASGAVMHDILNVAKARNPLVKFKLFSVPVQGEGAAPTIAAGIRTADADPEVDCIIVGRGGGSLEDLWCFNDREVVEAVYHAKKPIVSAVGHETDVTLCDWAADVRASTPSHAAELTVVPLKELLQNVAEEREYLYHQMTARVQEERQIILSIFNRKLGIPTLQLLQREKASLVSSLHQMEQIWQIRLQAEKQKLSLLGRDIERLNPVSVMLKGYTKVAKDGHAVRSVSQLAVDDTISMTFTDGHAIATIKEISYGSSNFKELREKE